MSAAEPVDMLDLMRCKTDVERMILEKETKNEVAIAEIKKDVHDMRGDIEKLVSKIEFAPVKMITYGLAGGVLMSALGAIMAKLLGW